MTLVPPVFSLRTVLAIGMAVSAFALTACGTNNSYMPPRTGYLDAPPRPTAAQTSLNYRIELGRGQAALTRAQIDGLNRFLAANGETDGDHIEIRTAAMSGPGRNTTIADALRSSFLAGGYAPSRVEIIDMSGYADVVEVSIQRYVVQLPDCGHDVVRKGPLMSWSDEPVDIRRLGCSNEYNFGLMVADPRDLQGGRPLDDAAGYHEVGAVQRYRTDQVKALVKTSTGTSSGGGSN